MVFQEIQNEQFEQIVYCHDPKVGLKAIVSMHSTALGPAVGGCRMWNYASEQEALTDVLRLSKGMTYKASISGLNWGGGKAVIMGDAKSATKNRAMLERFGEYIDRLGGNYVTAKDVGISSEDLAIVKTRTKHVLGIDGEPGSSGDPSPATAWGVYHGMKSCAKHAFGNASLKDLKIVVQGLGSVAYYMIEHLLAEGAKVIACDVDPVAVDRAVKKYGIEVVRADAIYDVPSDVFAPCALGAIINPQTLERLKTKIVAGAANNQLATSSDGMELMRRGIVYAPDYVINAGGLINIYYEGYEEGGYSKTRAFEHVERIGKTLTEILDRSKSEKQPSYLVADKIAEERVTRAKAK